MPRRTRGRGGEESHFDAAQRRMEEKAAQAPRKPRAEPLTAEGDFQTLVREYQAIEKMIWDLESRSPEARKNVLQERHKELSGQLAKKKAEAKAKGEELKKSQDRQKTLNSICPSLTKFKARVGDGLEKEKKEVANVVEALAADAKEMSEGIDVLEDQLGAVKRDLKNLGSQADELRSLKATQEGLLERVFNGPSGDPAENALEKEVQAMTVKKAKIAQSKTAHDSGLMHLTGALKQLHAAMGCLKAAGLFNTFDIIGNRPRARPGRPGNNQLIMNIAQAQKIRQANQALSEAKMNILQAKQYVPKLPRITDADISNMNILINTLFDNILTDLMQRKKIMNNIQALQKTMDSVKYAHRWLQELVGRINGDYQKVEKQLFTLRRKLMFKRQELMASIVNQGADLFVPAGGAAAPSARPSPNLFGDLRAGLPVGGPVNINVQINMPSSSTSSGPSPSAPPEESPSSSTSSDQTRSAPPASSSAEGKEPVIEEEEVEYGADDLGYEKEEEEEEEHTVQVPAPTFPDAYPDRNFSVSSGWSSGMTPLYFVNNKTEEQGKDKEEEEKEKEEKEPQKLSRGVTNTDLYGENLDEIL